MVVVGDEMSMVEVSSTKGRAGVFNEKSAQDSSRASLA